MVSWYSKKQHFVSTSTVEAEYIAAESCCAKILWIKNQLRDYGHLMNKILMHCDYTNTIVISKNLVHHSWTKHIKYQVSFLTRACHVWFCGITLCTHCHQIADIITKPLDESTFSRLVSDLVMLKFYLIQFARSWSEIVESKCFCLESQQFQSNSYLGLMNVSGYYKYFNTCSIRLMLCKQLNVVTMLLAFNKLILA